MSFGSFICERGKVRKKEGDHTVPSYYQHLLVVQSALHFGAAHLGSPFLWFLPLFLTPLCLDPAEPPRPNGEGGLSLVFTWVHLCC